MFGYVRPLKSELKVREWELYKAAYCGLCHALKKRYGFFSRFLVNYDFTFLIFLLQAVSEEKTSTCSKRCIASPVIKKCVYSESEILNFAADASVVLFYWKISDSAKDSSGIKKLLMLLAKAFFRYPYRCAEKRRPEFSKFTQEQLEQLNDFEKLSIDSIDMVADKFANILSHLANYIEDSSKRRAVSQILYHTGRYIYIIDAWDDLNKDFTKKEYNPIILRFGIDRIPITNDIEIQLKETLYCSIDAILAAYELISEPITDGVLRNIISFGLPATVDLVASGEFNNKRRKKQMKDPYSVIGVSRNATDDEIKKAYRDLAKKYHPDNYVNNPLADLAQEKMKEINEAYDFITKERSGHATSNSSAGYSNTSYSSTNQNANNRIRQLIMSGNIQLAEQELNKISTRDAEWYFLLGSIQVRKGWYDEAKRNFQTACSMNPSNAEYRAALNQLSGMGGPYQTGMSGMNACDCCTSLMCANMFCDCCGGGC